MATHTKKSGTRKPSRKTRESVLSEEALQTRKRILDTAEKVFSRKGFDGARVDEIAEEAGVNKALIYYYFESKTALLEELVERAVRELVAEKQAAFAASPLRLDLAKGEVPTELVRNGISITSRFLAIFGILCVEAFKDDDRVPALFKVMDGYLGQMQPLLAHAGVRLRSLDDLRFPGVFFGLAPLLFFQLLKDKWAAYYKVDARALEERFLDSFSSMYGTWVRVAVAEMKKA